MLLYMNKSKSMISNKSISNSIINNDMILPLLGVAITLYSVMIVPKINLKLRLKICHELGTLVCNIMDNLSGFVSLKLSH